VISPRPGATKTRETASSTFVGGMTRRRFTLGGRGYYSITVRRRIRKKTRIFPLVYICKYIFRVDSVVVALSRNSVPVKTGNALIVVRALRIVRYCVVHDAIVMVPAARVTRKRPRISARPRRTGNKRARASSPSPATVALLAASVCVYIYKRTRTCRPFCSAAKKRGPLSVIAVIAIIK